MIWLRSCLFNIAFYGWTTFICGLVMPFVFLFAKPVGVFFVGRFWARISMAMARLICGIGHQVVGLEHLPEGPCIVAVKHQSAWDTLVFSQLLYNPSYVLKKELTRIPFFGWSLLRVGMVAVDRSGGAKALKDMLAAAKRRIAEGRQILIYPEGTRTAPGQRRPYHPGVAALYRELGVPVVPVALNSGLFWGRRAFTKTPGTITVEFLPPIAPGMARKAFMARLEEDIEGASERLCQVG
ncbi:MAG: lysophospholipid acyltransferase family protein [Pseudomonadota bacterium]